MERTKRMIQHLLRCEERYAQLRAEERDLDFYTEIQPFCEKAFQQIDEWYGATTEWVSRCAPRHVHHVQLHHTKEALEQLTVQSYHRTASRAMFKKSAQSVHYTLKTILEEGECDE